MILLIDTVSKEHTHNQVNLTLVMEKSIDLLMLLGF